MLHESVQQFEMHALSWEDQSVKVEHSLLMQYISLGIMWYFARDYTSTNDLE